MTVAANSYSDAGTSRGGEGGMGTGGRGMRSTPKRERVSGQHGYCSRLGGLEVMYHMTGLLALSAPSRNVPKGKT